MDIGHCQLDKRNTRRVERDDHRATYVTMQFEACDTTASHRSGTASRRLEAVDKWKECGRSDLQAHCCSGSDCGRRRPTS